ncbi:MAG: RCC1 domain-containing protein [Sandaracinaceae bacterium]|nr:RCC1 domain-containing protein [Sandaracinaceae bacterium]
MAFGPQLTDLQITRAIEYDRARFSGAHLEAVRRHLGLPAAGAADEAFVRHVATWQETFLGAGLGDGKRWARGRRPTLGILLPEAQRAAEAAERAWAAGGVLFDSWGNDMRDNDLDGAVDDLVEQAPDGAHFGRTYPRFGVRRGRYRGGWGFGRRTVEVRDDRVVEGGFRYAVCADVVSDAYHAAGVMERVGSTAEILRGLRRNGYVWRRSEGYPAAYLPGDFICTWAPGGGPLGHRGRGGAHRGRRVPADRGRAPRPLLAGVGRHLRSHQDQATSRGTRGPASACTWCRRRTSTSVDSCARGWGGRERARIRPHDLLRARRAVRARAPSRRSPAVATSLASALPRPRSRSRPRPSRRAPLSLRGTGPHLRPQERRGWPAGATTSITSPQATIDRRSTRRPSCVFPLRSPSTAGRPRPARARKGVSSTASAPACAAWSACRSRRPRPTRCCMREGAARSRATARSPAGRASRARRARARCSARPPARRRLGLHPTDADRVCAVAASGLARCFRTSAIPDVVTIEPSRVAAPPRAVQPRERGRARCEIGDGAVRCSGRGSSGQLGDGRPDRHAEPVEVAGVEDAVQLDGRDGRVCALLSSGRVLCWGRAPRSERPAPSLGRPVTVGVDDPDFVPRALDLPEPVLEVRANGDGPTCVRTAGGWSCLYDRWRRDGSVGGTRHTWLDEVGAPPMRHVAADGTCGASRDGRLICASGLVAGDEAWGLSSWIAMRAEARFVGASSAFARGEHGHACGRTEDGRVRCFRLPAHGEPVAVRSPSLDALAGVVHLEAASSGDDALACALTAQGTVHCFGDHRFRSARAGPARGRPRRLHGGARRGLPPAVEIVVGATHACARTSGGRVWCWGDDREGTAPDGSSPESAEPVRVVWPPREDSAH